MLRRFRSFYFMMLVGCSLSVSGQSYKGIWQGVITGKDLVNESQYTLNVKTQEANVITGRAYLYSNYLYVFYGIFDFIGTVDGKNVKLTELRLRTYEMPDSIRSLCIKYGTALYSVNDTAEYLTGNWGNSRGNCPTGEIYLKRMVAGKKSNVKVPDVVMNKITEDKNEAIPFLQTTLSKPVIVSVSSTNITLSINDYLREDNDTVSVYFNRQPIIEHLKISHKPYSKLIRLDRLSGLNELIVFANNLGLYPPNTSTLIIDDGRKKQRVSISSSLEKSAAIYLNYEP